jgi:heme exporter protein B
VEAGALTRARSLERPGTPAAAWVAEAVAIFLKDWRTELRTRHALYAVLLFAVTTLLTVGLSLGPLGVASSERGSVLPVILWIILLFAAAAGLPRSFAQEEETHTATALRLSATPSALFAGKLAYATSLLWALELVLVPLFVGMVQLPLARPALLLAALAAGGLGLAAASTLIAAMVAQTSARGALFPILAFPVLLPLLLLVVELSRGAVTGSFEPAVLAQLLLYNASLVVAGLMLFPLVWNP